jgi:hypothetical protein
VDMPLPTRSSNHSRGALAALFSAALIAGCGGGGDSPAAAAPSAAPAAVPTPPPPPAPAPAPADIAFATPASATDTAEAGKIETYTFAEKGAELTPGAIAYATGEVSYGSTLSAAQAYAGTAVRLYAPGNTGSAPRSAFDASGFTQLKIRLRSSTDALLSIKLQPNPVAADGCTATAQAIVNASTAELVIDLNDTSFPLPDYCNGTGSKVSSVKAGLYAVDVINAATSAGAHDLAVGTAKLAP